MARIRTVKPEFFTHPEIVRLSIPARLLFLSLLTQVDDEGRLYDQPRRIGANAFGEGDRIHPDRLLTELAEHGRIRRYEAGGRRCLLVEHFRKHQRIDKPSSSNIPEPFPEDSSKPPRTLAEDSQGEVEVEQGSGTGNREVDIAPASRRDEIFEALAQGCGIDWHHLTPSSRHELNTAKKALLEAGDATPDEVLRRAEAYRLTYPTMALTPSALAKHWPALANGARGGQALATGDRILMRALQGRGDDAGA